VGKRGKKPRAREKPAKKRGNSGRTRLWQETMCGVLNREKWVWPKTKRGASKTLKRNYEMRIPRGKRKERTGPHCKTNAWGRLGGGKKVKATTFTTDAARGTFGKAAGP